MLQEPGSSESQGGADAQVDGVQAEVVSSAACNAAYRRRAPGVVGGMPGIKNHLHSCRQLRKPKRV